MKRLDALLSFALLSCACVGAPAHPQRPPLDAGPLQPPSAIGFDFQWRQRVTARWPSGTRSFDAVLQKRGGELMLVGLSPLGQAGFVLRLGSSGAIAVENHTGRALPFPPEFILSDVERVYFPWLPPPPAAMSGERQGDYGVLHIVERYQAGELRERRFTRRDAAERGTLRIVYSARAPGADAARKIELDNAWFGYRLTIDTFEQLRL